MKRRSALNIQFLLFFAIIINESKLQIMDLDMGHNKIFRFYTFMTPCTAEVLEEASVSNVQIHKTQDKSGTKYLIDYDFHLSGDLNDFKAEILFSRCASRESLDSCAQMPVLSTNAGCKFVTASNAAWTPLVNCSKPAVRCPLKKGFYKFRNCQLDLKLYNFMPLGRAYWRIQISMSVNEKRLCMKCEGAIVK